LFIARLLQLRQWNSLQPTPAVASAHEDDATKGASVEGYSISIIAASLSTPCRLLEKLASSNPRISSRKRALGLLHLQYSATLKDAEARKKRRVSRLELSDSRRKKLGDQGEMLQILLSIRRTVQIRSFGNARMSMKP
jgi:hypothetical protein